MTVAAPASSAATVERAESHISIKYRRDIDGLRAIAVLAVLVFHAFPGYLPGGFVGVDVFFVISGFLITKVILASIAQGTFSVADFYVRRIRRIFPALLLVLVACLAFGWQTLLAEDLKQLAKHVFGGATFSSNLLLWQEASYFDKASETKPLLHLWSLGIEEQFYVVWPLLMWLAWRRGFPIAKLIAITAAVSFLANVVGIDHHQTATFYSPLSRAWELLLGAALSQDEVLPKATQAQRSIASLVGVVMIVAAAFGLTATSRFPGWWALLPVLGTCMIIFAGPAAWANRVILSSSALVAVGLISFPLYLWHWPLLTLGHDWVPDGAEGKFILLSLSVAFAWATYAFVEKPLRYGNRANLKVAVLSALMLFVGCAAAALFAKGGVPSRYPEVIQNATRQDITAFSANIRYRQCFIEIDQNLPNFPPECVDHQPGKPLVMLWGDSGGAALYPGFQHLAAASSKFTMAQFTSSACPPLLGFESSARPACKGNNLKTFEFVRNLKPEIVVLSAIWQYYDRAQLRETISALKNAGVGRVVVIGPGPTWKVFPGRTVLKLWQRDPLHRVPPARLDHRVYGQFEGAGPPAEALRRAGLVEVEMRKVTGAAGATYISVLDAMCSAQGCLTRASDESADAFFLDTAHLNPNGSVFVVEAIGSQLMSAISGLR